MMGRMYVCIIVISQQGGSRGAGVGAAQRRRRGLAALGCSEFSRLSPWAECIYVGITTEMNQDGGPAAANPIMLRWLMAAVGILRSGRSRNSQFMGGDGEQAVV